MPPKDIRAFFGGKPKAAAGAKTGDDKAKGTPAKPPKPSPAKATQVKKASPGKAPPANKASTPVKQQKAAPKAKAAPKSKKRKLVIQSDSEFEFDDEDEDDEEDFEIESDEDDDDIEPMDEDDPEPKKPAKGSAKVKAGKKVVTISSSDDAEEVLPPPKKRRAPATESKATAPAKPAGRALPTSLATPTEKKKPSPAARKSGASAGGRKKSAAELLEESLTDSARKAIKAVEAAIRKLPSDKELLDSEQITRMAEGAAAGGWGGGGGADKEPENHGNVEYPKGHPDCLAKITIVISGVLDSMMRHDATEFIKRHGGRVTTGVTGKTTFLLCGKETGNSKFNAAKDKGTKLLTEQGLLELVKASAPFVEQAATEQAAEPMEEDDIMEVDPPKLGTSSAATSSKPSTSKAGTSKAVPKPVAPPEDPGAQLWVDKWKPKTCSDLVGNPQGQTIIRQWLQDWVRVHLHGEAPRPAPGAAGQRKDMSKKALLVSGPPGIGKTTAAHIISKELGYEVVEVNASDTRNKSDSKLKEGIHGKTSNRIKELVTNTAISLGGIADTHARRQVLVMDEVDGMSGGDRGGVSDLIASIKISKMPIICVCNDKYKTSLKSLKNHCLELDWRKPTKLQAAGRLKKIATAEGLTINQAALDALVETSQGDMRVMLGQLQMHRVRAKALTYDDVKGGASKDVDKSPFESARALLSVESCSWTLMDRLDAVFQDADLVPLLVQENYLNHKPSMAQDENTAMQIIAKAADAFSAGDVINKRVRMKQEWQLMPAAAMLGTVYPAAYMRGPRVTFQPNEMNFPRFTSWLGNNSSHGKQKRVSAELNTKLLASGVVCSRTNVRLQYLPALRVALTKPLATEGADGIDEVISLMQHYLISRDDFDSILDITKLKTKGGWGADPMQGVETKVKAAFTRSFNKTGLPVRCTIMVEDGKKAKGRAKAAPPPVDGDEEMGGEIAEAAAVNAKDDEETEAPTEEDIQKMGLKFTAKQPVKGKGKAASKAGGAGRGAKAGRGGKAGRGKGK